MSSVRELIASLRNDDDRLDCKDGISLLSLKHHILLTYMQSLALVNTRRVIGHTLSTRTPPAEPFSSADRITRGDNPGDLVDSMIEGRIALEKISILEGRMRYQIEKLMRLAEEPEKSTNVADDPLAFRPNPQNLLDAQNDGDSDAESVASRASHSAGKDEIYRPPRLAPMPYNPTTSKEKRASKRTALPPPTALRALADPSQPHAESTSGLGTTPSLQSARARYLTRLNNYEEENFTRVVMRKRDALRRERDEEDMALGADLSDPRRGGKNRRRGGLEDEFGDVLKDAERAGGAGDAYEELRQRGKKRSLLERSRARREEAPEEDEGERPGKKRKTRFELAAKSAGKRMKKQGKRA
ncbi:hypothetical protein BD626DRAFT_548578 [Schizophyllum amplum]|nr:hypothetical protein BD626DRAFT_548578 [Auriculariopsis ampla]